MSKPALSPIPEIIGWSSPRPWTYHYNYADSLLGRDRIEDANGNTVVENVGHLDGPLICAAVNYLYDRETENESAVRTFIELMERAE